jgi:hypothetical protein
VDIDPICFGQTPQFYGKKGITHPTVWIITIDRLAMTFSKRPSAAQGLFSIS